MKSRKYNGKQLCECSTGVEYPEKSAPYIVKCRNIAKIIYFGEYEKPHPNEAAQKVSQNFWKLGCLICSDCLARKKESYERDCPST